MRRDGKAIASDGWARHFRLLFSICRHRRDPVLEPRLEAGQAAEVSRRLRRSQAWDPALAGSQGHFPNAPGKA